MAWPAAAFRLPPVAHVVGAARHDEVVLGPEEHVAAGQYLAAMLHGREIELVSESSASPPFRDDLAMYAKPGHTAIGIDLQPQVRKGNGGVDGEGVLRIALQRLFRQDLDSLCLRPPQCLDAILRR